MWCSIAARKLSFVFLLALLESVTAFNPNSALADENPFRSRRFLEGSLEFMNFNKEILDITAHITEDEPIVVSNRMGSANITDLVIGGDVRHLRMTEIPLTAFLILNGIVTMAPAYDSEQSAVILSFPDPDALNRYNAIRRSIGLDEIYDFQEGRNHRFSVPLYKKVIDYETERGWTYRDWQEGNVTYAMVIGDYVVLDNIRFYDADTRQDDLIAGSQHYKFKLIVEKNPARNEWVFSSYRGEDSNLGSGGALQSVDRFISRSANFEVFFYGRAKAAAALAAEKAVSDEFSNYRQVGNILQVELDGASNIMVHLNPIQGSADYKTLLDRAIVQCESQSVDGFKSWHLPDQWEIAQVFLGQKEFSWDEPKALNLPPDGRFWGPFFDNIRSIYVAGDTAFLSRNVEFVKNRYGTGQRRSVYYIKMHTRLQTH